jgi:hypothetical protein
MTALMQIWDGMKGHPKFWRCFSRIGIDQSSGLRFKGCPGNRFSNGDRTSMNGIFARKVWDEYDRRAIKQDLFLVIVVDIV